MDTICLNCGWTFPVAVYPQHVRGCLDGAHSTDEKARRLAQLVAAEFDPAVPRDAGHWGRARLLVLNARRVLDAIEADADTFTAMERSLGEGRP